MNDTTEEWLGLQDKVVLITGAGRGRSAAHAHRFSMPGARVVLGDTGQEQQ
ncbi:MULTISPECIES: hypothetical protein [Nocardia]|uniref:hypothetical protein n=1 Tax=Nocardia TaxID=1817 RepID=UPI000A90E444|nr:MULTISPECIES: hypothetical protein [Nocardia]MBF6277957.1 hypothetical protein [Nocardia nova]